MGTDLCGVQKVEMGYCTSKWGTVGNPARHTAIFGDTIHSLHINRNNSTLNIERRYLEYLLYHLLLTKNMHVFLYPFILKHESHNS